MRSRAFGLAAIVVLAGACQPDAAGRKAKPKADPLAPQMALTPLELTAKASLDKRAADEAAVAALEKRVKPAMDVYLLDPFSAQYRQLRSGRNGAVCGQVNAKNRLGAYVGFKDFVLGRDGKAVYVSKYSDGVASEIYSSFADAYVNACATPQERQRHAAAVKSDEDYYYPSYDAASATTDAAAADDQPLEDPFADE
jgi:hypothetical protein